MVLHLLEWMGWAKNTNKLFVSALLSVCLCSGHMCVCVCVCTARFELTLLPSCRRCLNFLNNLVTGIIFLTLVVNIVKAAYGTQRSCLLRWLFQRFVLWETIRQSVFIHSSARPRVVHQFASGAMKQRNIWDSDYSPFLYTFMSQSLKKQFCKWHTSLIDTKMFI